MNNVQNKGTVYSWLPSLWINYAWS